MGKELQRLAKIEPKHCTKKTDSNDVDLLKSTRFKAQTNIVNCEHISLNKLIRILERRLARFPCASCSTATSTSTSTSTSVQSMSSTTTPKRRSRKKEIKEETESI